MLLSAVGFPVTANTRSEELTLGQSRLELLIKVLSCLPAVLKLRGVHDKHATSWPEGGMLCELTLGSLAGVYSLQNAGFCSQGRHNPLRHP